MGREGRRGKVPIRALAVSNVVYSKQTSIKVTARVFVVETLAYLGRRVFLCLRL